MGNHWKVPLEKYLTQGERWCTLFLYSLSENKTYDLVNMLLLFALLYFDSQSGAKIEKSSSSKKLQSKEVV